MAYTEYRTLSIRKAYEKVQSVEPIFLREGDHGAKIVITVEDNGAAFDLSGYSLTFVALTADGKYVSEPASQDTSTNNVAIYNVSSSLTSKVGRSNVAYLRLAKDSETNSETLSTDAIPLVILPNADTKTSVQAQAWESAAQAMLDQLQQILDTANTEGKDYTYPYVNQFKTTASGNFLVLLRNPDTPEENEISDTYYATNVTLNPSTGSIKADTFVGNLTGNASTATSAESASTATSANKLSVDDAGSATNPVYFADGKPAACDKKLDVDISGNAESATSANSAAVAEKIGSETVGGTAQPVYVDAGSVTAFKDTIGSASQPVYVDDGVLKQCTDIAASGTNTEHAAEAEKLVEGDGENWSPISAGSESTPVYFAEGVPVATKADIGDESTPVFMKAGVLTPCGDINPESNLTTLAVTVTVPDSYIDKVGATVTVNITVENTGNINAKNVYLMFRGITPDSTTGNSEGVTIEDCLIASINAGNSSTKSVKAVGRIANTSTVFNIVCFAENALPTISKTDPIDCDT